MRGRIKTMLYSQTDIKTTAQQLVRRIVCAVLLAIIPNIAAGVIMATVRIQGLSILLGCLGGALAIFYWGLFVSPVIAYLRYVREVVPGRSHQFHGTLRSIAQDSVRDGVPCKTLYFYDEEADDEKLCYYDLIKYPKEGFAEGNRFAVTVHGQSIVAMQPE